MNMNDFVCFDESEIWVDGMNEVKENILSRYEGNSKKVEIPVNFEMIEVDCFKDNHNIEEVIIPESVKVIKSGSFSECKNLKSVKIPDNLCSVCPDSFDDVSETARILKTNPNYVEKNGFIINEFNKSLLFALDPSKKSYDIPEGVESIGMNAFAGCTNLKKIKIPYGVKSIQLMGFFMCSNLEKVDFPEGLEYIGEAAFALCKNLKDFSIPSGTKIEKKLNDNLNR